MTAINVVRTPASVHMFSDGASTDAQGSIIGIAPKALPMPHLNAAVGVRGSSAAAALLVHSMGFSARSYDDLADNAVTMFREALKIHDQVFSQAPGGLRMELIIAGFSERSGPHAFTISNVEASGIPAFGVVEIPNLAFAPHGPEYSPAIDALKSVHLNVPSWDHFDFEAFGVQTMQIQRQVAREQGRKGNAQNGAVGGFALLHSITKASIVSRIVHRWEDKIGDNFYFG
jgi:hypothetical protein